MGAFIDLSGHRYGRLTVIERAGNRILPNGRGKTMWSCVCDCGSAKEIGAIELRVGQTKSCGCLHREGVSRMMSTHRLSNSATYTSWQSMKRRCNTPNEPSYGKYGGAGITHCAEWKDFENFLADMGERPENTSLDRIDNCKGYDKDNCRWASRKQQNENRKHIKPIDYLGERITISEIARREGIGDNYLRHRLRTGLELGEAIRQARVAQERRLRRR